MDQPHLVPWQYIFGRGLTIFILLNLYLYFEEGINFIKIIKKLENQDCLEDVVLRSNDFIYLFNKNTTAAITLLCLAAMPFLLLYWRLFLKEELALMFGFQLSLQPLV